MNTDKYNKILNTYKETKMSHAEREYIKSNLVDMGVPVVKTKSYYFTRVAVNALAIIIILLGSFTYASANSTPGDILYKAKINLTENVKLMLIPDADSRLEFQISRLDERIDDLTYADSKSVDLILENISDISASIIDDSNKMEDPEDAIVVQNKLQSKLNGAKNIKYKSEKIKTVISSNIEKVDGARKYIVEDYIGNKVANNYDIEELTEDTMRFISVAMRDAEKDLESLEEFRRNRSTKLNYTKVSNQLDHMRKIAKEMMVYEIQGNYIEVMSKAQEFKSEMMLYNNMVRSLINSNK